MNRTGIFISIIVFILSLGLYSCDSHSPGIEEEKRKNLQGKTIIETGELSAVNAKVFILQRNAYWYQMRVIGILKHGTVVHPGDSIIQMDPTDVQRYIISRETNLETQLVVLEKLKVDQMNMINDLESNLKTEQASFNLRKIALESSRFESERLKKIRELEFEQSKINLAKEAKKIELNKIINYNDMKIQMIKVNQLKKQIQDLYDIIKSMTIRTPYPGVFQIAWNYQTRSLIKEGDFIYAGNNLALVPDLEWMKVKTFINENDFLKIYSKQKVSVRLDAMPELVFNGEVSYIGKFCRIKERGLRQKGFDVEVSILKPDTRLKPGMTVSCEFLDCK